MRHLKKILETDAGPIDSYWFHKKIFRFFEFSFFTNADVVTIDVTSK